MKKAVLFSFLVLVLATLVAPASQAADSQVSESTPNNQSETTAPGGAAAPSLPKWKASISTTYFDMGGTRAANRDFDYSYGDSWVSVESMNLQYSVAPEWTISATAQYIDNYYEFQLPGFAAQQQRTSGMGDTSVEVIHPLISSGGFFLIGDLGMSIPTGSINESNKDFPAYHYGYYIQLGSGTPDTLAGLTALYQAPRFQLGTRVSTDVRMGTNSNGYRDGDIYQLDSWINVPVIYGITPRIVGHVFRKTAMYGADPTLPRQPLTEYYYHDQTNWDVAAAVKYELSVARELSLGAEAGVPIFQGMSNYDDLQISTHFYGSLSLNGHF